MRRFVIAVALACALSSTALAGNIPTSDVSPPPPPPEDTQTTLSGYAATTDYAPLPAEDSLLTVLLTMLGVL